MKRNITFWRGLVRVVGDIVLRLDDHLWLSRCWFRYVSHRLYKLARLILRSEPLVVDLLVVSKDVSLMLQIRRWRSIRLNESPEIVLQPSLPRVEEMSVVLSI